MAKQHLTYKAREKEILEEDEAEGYIAQSWPYIKYFYTFTGIKVDNSYYITSSLIKI